MLVAYTIEDEAEEIDLELIKVDNPKFKYILFKYSLVEERIAAIHANEMVNIKARYEMLYDIGLD